MCACTTKCVMPIAVTRETFLLITLCYLHLKFVFSLGLFPKIGFVLLRLFLDLTLFDRIINGTTMQPRITTPGFSWTNSQLNGFCKLHQGVQMISGKEAIVDVMVTIKKKWRAQHGKVLLPIFNALG